MSAFRVNVLETLDLIAIVGVIVSVARDMVGVGCFGVRIVVMAIDVKINIGPWVVIAAPVPGCPCRRVRKGKVLARARITQTKELNFKDFQRVRVPREREAPSVAVRQSREEGVPFAGQQIDLPDSVIDALLVGLDLQMMGPRPPVPAYGDPVMTKMARYGIVEIISESPHGCYVGCVLLCLVSALLRSSDPGMAGRVSDRPVHLAVRGKVWKHERVNMTIGLVFVFDDGLETLPELPREPLDRSFSPFQVGQPVVGASNFRAQHGVADDACDHQPRIGTQSASPAVSSHVGKSIDLGSEIDRIKA